MMMGVDDGQVVVHVGVLLDRWPDGAIHWMGIGAQRNIRAWIAQTAAARRQRRTPAP